jgi:hypothetical protein
LGKYAKASGDNNPIHLSERAAKDAGLDGVIAHGMLIAAWMNESLARAGYQILDMKFRFRAMTFLEDVIVVEHAQDVDKIRGVDSSHFLRRLLEKQLIEVSGRSELPGRPMLYSTTSTFLEIFTLNGLADLPPLREIEKMVPTSEVGAEGAAEGAEAKDEEPVDPRVREMRKMVNTMNSDRSSLNYDPKQDEQFLTEIRERVSKIPTTTPTLVALAEEIKQAQAQKAAGDAPGETPAEADAVPAQLELEKPPQET